MKTYARNVIRVIIRNDVSGNYEKSSKLKNSVFLNFKGKYFFNPYIKELLRSKFEKILYHGKVYYAFFTFIMI